MFKPRAPRNRSEALIFTCINLLATPGLGMILARRFSCGIPQLLLAVSGFALIFWWFTQKMRVLYDQVGSGKLPLNLGNTAGLVGLSLFATAWIWSLVTSVRLFRSINSQPMNVPPKLF